MSQLLRPLHIMSSLKSNSDKDFYPFCKVIAPILTTHPAVRRMQTQSVDKYLQLKITREPKNEAKIKPLAVLLSWMLAKDKHIDRYRAMYVARGFDVLTVNVGPKDLLFPVKGSQVIAENVLDYLANNQQYDKVVVHAFSVGCYLMGEMFIKMRENEEKYQDIPSRIVGVITDSAVDVEGTPTGVSRALSRNPITMKLVEWCVSGHLALMYGVATKHYIKASKNYHNTPLRCPALLLVSEADLIGSHRSNKLAAENWQVRGVDVRLKSWKDSKHVGHMFKYQDEYIKEVDNFLDKIKLNKN